MKLRYYSVDGVGWKRPIIAILICWFLPVIGPIWFGIKVTSKYSDVRAIGGINAIAMLLLHITLIIMALKYEYK